MNLTSNYSRVANYGVNHVSGNLVDIMSKRDLPSKWERDLWVTVSRGANFPKEKRKIDSPKIKKEFDWELGQQVDAILNFDVWKKWRSFQYLEIRVDFRLIEFGYGDRVVKGVFERLPFKDKLVFDQDVNNGKGFHIYEDEQDTRPTEMIPEDYFASR